MASFMDIGLLGNFSVIFIFLLIFTIIYAVLEYRQPFGKNKSLHAIIALATAFLIAVSKDAISLVSFMTPWFLVLFLFIFFMLFSVMMFGATEKDARSIIKDTRVYPYIIIIAIVILIAGFSQIFGQKLLEQGQGVDGQDYQPGDVILPGDVEGGPTNTASFQDNVLNTIIHPKVLGMIAIFVIGLFTLIFLTRTS